MDKKNLRKLMKEKRNSITETTRQKFDNDIFFKIINSNYYKLSKVIFVFVSYNDEINTHKLIKHALQNNKKVVVPKVVSKNGHMIALEINSFDDLEPSNYGILEPKNYCKEIPSKDIDLALIPGLAFDLNGGRMGYGGGYYDRFLKTLSSNCPKIGICYNFQVIQNVPMSEHDIKTDGLITN
ncbi:5-formyltetrahydrofolate cyclo-ligase [Haloimpatiens lingqiaonensis]|uniref:5-formyltetrahydrofolate cyclo-ligase n=1 Tax=Haloimpatiens lingqiaonensis TaxID=1380675 RepID=UPI001485A796|nr:5-formyltetrahydrofolate cyclo-ligase [Haloimpatiens lingqiaonensis]